MTYRITHQVALALAALSVVAIGLSLLALQDIYHGEEDLRAEWMVLRISFMTIMVFHGFALFALYKCRSEAMR